MKQQDADINSAAQYEPGSGTYFEEQKLKGIKTEDSRPAGSGTEPLGESGK